MLLKGFGFHMNGRSTCHAQVEALQVRMRECLRHLRHSVCKALVFEVPQASGGLSHSDLECFHVSMASWPAVHVKAKNLSLIHI